MASFIGTNKQFRRYIGPILRNIVQQLTKTYKKKMAVCQHCSETENLEAAHINEKSRNDIIDQVLESYTFNGLVTVNIERFEEEFKKAHHPIETSILVLCKKCHKIYDSPTKEKTLSDVKKKYSNIQDTLSITLLPSTHSEFKKELLIYKKASIETIYLDGTAENEIWNAAKFRESSDVFGNLRSRPKFRKDNWKKLGIKKVNVKIIK